MKNNKKNFAHILIVVLLLVTAIAVNLGAFTRLVDAGLGCPDWPGCYGHAMWPTTASEVAQANQAFPGAPVEADKTWPEMVHRYFATSVGALILLLTAAVWRTGYRKLATGLVVAVCLQGAFGAWTVTLKLWPQVVTAHLLGGFSILALLWLMAQRLFKLTWVNNSGLKALQPLALAALLVVIAQIGLGGWTSSNYAALACTDLPTCHGQWVPDADYAAGFDVMQEIGPNYLGGQLDNSARIAIHFTHRIGALITFLTVSLLLILVWRRGDMKAKRWSVIGFAILGVQMILGLSNVVFAIPLPIAVMHNAGGVLLLLSMVTLNHRLWIMPKEVASKQEVIA